MENWQILLDKIIGKIEEATNLETLQIGRDMAVEGRTDTYTVDWFWEFRAPNGVIYKIVASVRNVEKTLTKLEMFSFSSMLQDISGQVVGVIFTQSVFDKGIHDIAKDVGILLYEMPTIQEKPRVVPVVGGLQLDIDKPWAAAAKEKAGLGSAQIPFSGNPEYMYLHDEGDVCLDTIAGIVKTYVKKYEAAPDTKKHIEHTFAEPCYLHTGHDKVPRLKLNGLHFDLSYRLVDAWQSEDIVERIVNAAIRRYIN